MRKTHVTFVNRHKSIEDEVKEFVLNNFNQHPLIEIEDNRIMKVSFKLDDTFTIIDDYSKSIVIGLPPSLSIHNLLIINQLIQKINLYNSYLDEVADFYVSQQ